MPVAPTSTIPEHCPLEELSQGCSFAPFWLLCSIGKADVDLAMQQVLCLLCLSNLHEEERGKQHTGCLGQWACEDMKGVVKLIYLTTTDFRLPAMSFTSSSAALMGSRATQTKLEPG